MSTDHLSEDVIALLMQLIEIPSFSGEESATADSIQNWLDNKGVDTKRIQNNVYAFNKHFDPSKPNLLLNSHHDTVRPNKAYTRDPHKAEVIDGMLFGLGSNDAGGALVSLLGLFTHFYAMESLSYNLIIAATAEEESSGPNGLNSLLKDLPEIDVAIVGEPTQMQLAIAEKGLVVFDAVVKGTAGHAAHPNNDNPIMKSVDVINWFEQLKFDRISDVLGPVKLTITQIEAGSQHNVVPSQVNMVLDVRVNESYSNQEIAEIVGQAPCEVTPRSLRLQSSSINKDHPLVIAGVGMGRNTYGSPTLSDQAALDCPSLKLGPGDSTRSHTADEFIYTNEIKEAVRIYIELLTEVIKPNV
jgi:acetylornithine deacetylase